VVTEGVEPGKIGSACSKISWRTKVIVFKERSIDCILLLAFPFIEPKDSRPERSIEKLRPKTEGLGFSVRHSLILRT